jgi:hypothetical protein
MKYSSKVIILVTIIGGCYLTWFCCKSIGALPEEAAKCPCDDLAAVHDCPCEDHKLHICAFHIAKDDPNFVVETQHYCAPLREGVFQCLLYETTAKGVRPRLLGVEYVVSDEIYQKLPAEEKKLWHHHDFEIRQGLLAPVGLPQECEQKTVKALVNSWGKTWHTWPDPSTDLPLGTPRLMWSAGKSGEVPDKMIKDRDQRWNMDTKELKSQRGKYLPQ